MAPENRDTEPIVELVRVASSFEASALVASLTARGINAYSRVSDEPRLAMIRPIGRGHSVMVFASDRDEAVALVTAEGQLDPSDGSE